MFAGLVGLETLVLKSNQLTCVVNETFSELSSIKYLSLYDNRITCMMSGTFDHMRSLTTLLLMANPFDCNCHLKWLPEWMSGPGSGIDTGNPRCAQPAHYKDVPISEIDSQEFKCEQQHDQASIELYGDNSANKLAYFEYFCSAGINCPLKCTCNLADNIVRCSRAKLKDFPKDVDPTTLELFVDNNEIRSLPSSSLRNLNELTLLDLSNNRLQVLPDQQFVNMTKLQTLILSYNKLQCIQPEAFAGLRSLRVLALHGNDISIVPQQTYKHLSASLSHLAIGSNPLYCDCHTRWLAEWIQRDYIEAGIAKCADPPHMRDKLLLTTSTNQFDCSLASTKYDTIAGYISDEPIIDVPVLAKCDACYTFPCQNGATCVSQANMDYQCKCLPNNYGKNCEFQIDACFDRPCENGATCTSLTSASSQNMAKQANNSREQFVCTCPSGFTGTRCHINIDDCIGHKCTNNATCVDLIDGYKCHCPPGFTGAYCETQIDLCQTLQVKCENGGTCVDAGPGHPQGYQCQCQTGFNGPSCENNIDDCVDHQCQNGAACVDGINTYTCYCHDPQTTGVYCEILGAPVALAMTGQINASETSAANSITLSVLPPVNVNQAPVVNPAATWNEIENTNTLVRTPPSNMLKSFQTQQARPGFENRGNGQQQDMSDNNELATGIKGSHQPHPSYPLCPFEVLSAQNLSEPVEHGVCVMQDGVPVYRCFAGFMGSRCEQAQSFLFKASNDSILEFDQYLDSSATTDVANISFRFATEEIFGPLFYTGNEMQHLTAELYLGRVRVGFSVGRNQARHIYSTHMVNDSNYHHVEIILYNDHYVNFTLDKHEHATIVASTSASGNNDDNFEFTDPYYFGGLDDGIYEQAQRLAQVWSSESKFRGCIKEMFVNGQSLSPAIAIRANKVKPGCYQFEHSDPCKPNNRCQKSGGTCEPIDRFNYKCVCHNGWSGEFCEEAPTCKRQNLRRYYEDNGCQSTRLLKLPECVGSCGSNCCRPSRTKKKRIHMQCPDGSTYTKNIEVIRRCSCASCSQSYQELLTAARPT
ncbi:Protein slit [Fragariocoptes setiger]|uniref:Protein slit n=1 Tax=Fragariocoptes setiger TaxID=1670756 RepID=A0ABQ7S9D2_9ACAR|nr:Protein slit [Fragariocoptes setiger]